MPNDIQRAAWRPEEWRKAVPVSKGQLTNWLRDGAVASVGVGRMRFITESPKDFLARHAGES